MEYQEGQIYSILVARQRFPDGVPTRLGFRELFAKDEVRGEIVTFANFTNLEQQSRAAQEALDHPVELTMSRLLHKVRKEEQPEQSQGEETFDEKEYEQRERKRLQKRLTQGIEYEAQRNWWEWWNEHGAGLKIMKAVAAHLRPRYANKTIYEIFEAKTTEEQHEVLSAFWRREGTRQMAHEEENWIVHELYLRPDGVLELHYVDSVYHKRERYKETGALENDWNVASVDQAVRWIREEMDGMKAVKEKWQTAGFSPTQALECTLVSALGEKIDPSSREEIEELPDWFVKALTKEQQLYSRLPRAFVPKSNPEDLLFSIAMKQEPEPANLLKDYFIVKQGDLDRFRSLLTTPQELYADLELDASATVDDVKVAYRRIAKETRAIHISSADKFDKKEWEEMNDKFIKATKAYHALTRFAVIPSRIATLGKIREYFS